MPGPGVRKRVENILTAGSSRIAARPFPDGVFPRVGPALNRSQPPELPPRPGNSRLAHVGPVNHKRWGGRCTVNHLPGTANFLGGVSVVEALAGQPGHGTCRFRPTRTRHTSTSPYPPPPLTPDTYTHLSTRPCTRTPTRPHLRPAPPTHTNIPDPMPQDTPAPSPCTPTNPHNMAIVGAG